MNKIVLVDIPDKVKEFLLMPNGIEKNIRFSDMQGAFPLVTYLVDSDGNEYFSSTNSYITRLGDNYFIKNRNVDGLSFKNGKVKLWFGKELKDIRYAHLFFNLKRWDFIEPKFYSFITKGVLVKLFKGKITNTRDMLREWLKSVRLKCSVELLYKAVKNNNNFTKNFFYRHAIIAKDIDNFLKEYMVHKFSGYSHLGDIMEQFRMLNRKVDFKWSPNRMILEHEKATKIIMGVKINYLEDVTINYPDVTLPQGFELINTKKRCFTEGSLMSHCVFTNYWGSIERGNYVVFHININNESATLGCTLNQLTGEMTFSQVYKKGNENVSMETKAFCVDFVRQNKYMFADFISGHKSKKLKQPQFDDIEEVRMEEFQLN